MLGEEPLDEEEDEEGGAGQVAGAPANPHHPDADKPSALAEYL